MDTQLRQSGYFSRWQPEAACSTARKSLDGGFQCNMAPVVGVGVCAADSVDLLQHRGLLRLRAASGRRSGTGLLTAGRGWVVCFDSSASEH